MRDYYSLSGKFANKVKSDMMQNNTCPKTYCTRTACALCEYVCYSRNNGCPLTTLKDEQLQKEYNKMLEDIKQ